MKAPTEGRRSAEEHGFDIHPHGRHRMNERKRFLQVDRTLPHGIATRAQA